MMLTRPFSPTDVPSIIAIVKESLGESYPPSLYLTVSNLWREGFLVLVDEGRMVGFVAAVPSGTKVSRILMLAVLPQMRRRSNGQRLMRDLYENSLAKGFDTVILEVRKSNKDAIAFYERQGFTTYGEIENFYSNGDAAYKMMKVLES